MIDLLIKLLEKFIEQAKHREEMEAKPFALLISPLYSKLEEIHRDYLRLFESYHSELESGIQLEVVAKHLAANRIEQEALRHSVIAFAKSYKDNPRLNPYQNFFSKVTRYFQSTNLRDCEGKTRSSYLLVGMRLLMSGKGELKGFKSTEKDYLRNYLTDITQQTLSSIRESWKEISQEFARLSAKRATS